MRFLLPSDLMPHGIGASECDQDKCKLLFPQEIVTKDAFPYGNHSGFLIFIAIPTNCSCLPGGAACLPSPTKIKRLAEGRLPLASCTWLLYFHVLKPLKQENCKKLSCRGGSCQSVPRGAVFALGLGCSYYRNCPWVCPCVAQA